MDAWWTAVATAVGWTVVVGLWGILTRTVANALLAVGLLAGAVLALVDQRPGWHALGFVAALAPAVGLYAAGMMTAGTAKGMGVLGGILGLGAAPALLVVGLGTVAVTRSRKEHPSSQRIFLVAIAVAAGVHAAHVLPAALL
jgi:Flp pilus assembly protein protease CpaA